MTAEELQLFRDSLSGALREVSGVENFRKQVNGDNAYPSKVWQTLFELGCCALLVEEAKGGLGLGAREALILSEEIGKSLSLSAIVPSALISTYAISKFTSGDVQGDVLPNLLSGEYRVSYGPGDLRELKSGKLISNENAGVFSLSGSIQSSVSFAESHAVLALATNGDTYETLLVLIDKETNGLSSHDFVGIDGRSYSKLSFQNVEVSAARVFRSDCQFQKFIAFGALIYGGEQIGAAQAAFNLTLDYLKQREQFGKRIGSYQALQHRAAIMKVELAKASALLRKAARELDQAGPDAEKLCFMAKAKASQVSGLVVNEAVQMHGGIGMTEEYDVGLYLKRVAVSEKLFGGVDYHTKRTAELHGI